MWSIGTLVALPGATLLFIGLVVGGFFVFSKRHDSYDGPMALFGAIAAWVLAVFVVVFTLWGMYPYNAEYHKWQTTSGTVHQVSSRFLGDSKSTTQRYVVQFADGRERSCDDTRCSLVKVGDQLSLSCKRHWQYAGQDGWDCNFLNRRA